ncbi:MAG: HEPN domain protein [Candidatus Bathyarchaeota archaeon BA1]|nr:MAG: HEPN domain protein [Candidatus Bathyarchaeota archaeon BA1]
MLEELVESYRKQAEAALKAARIHYDNWNYTSCIHQAQLAVELTLKALLKKFTGDFPKIHDVGAALMEHAEKLPEPVKEKVGRLWFISKTLAAWREPSVYGLEARQVAPDKLFGKKDAEVAIGYAEEVYTACLYHLVA